MSDAIAPEIIAECAMDVGADGHRPHTHRERGPIQIFRNHVPVRGGILRLGVLCNLPEYPRGGRHALDKQSADWFAGTVLKRADNYHAHRIVPCLRMKYAGSSVGMNRLKGRKNS